MKERDHTTPLSLSDRVAMALAGRRGLNPSGGYQGGGTVTKRALEALAAEPQGGLRMLSLRAMARQP